MRLRFLLGVLLLATGAPAWADELELTSGTKYVGRVVEKTAESVTFRVVTASGTAEVKFLLVQVKALRIDGKVPAPPALTSKPAAPQPRTVPPDTGDKPAGGGKSKDEIDALLKSAENPPDWWDDTQLVYPQTMDMTWANPGGGWETQEAMGPYFYSVIEANPRRWREGVKFLAHTLTANKDNPAALQNSMREMGFLYGLLKDWPRSAFWIQKAIAVNAAGANDMDQVRLAEAYFRLEAKGLALQTLDKLGADRTHSGSAIKLWSDMGELDKALKAADAKASSGMPDVAYLAAGDACRRHGQFKRAIGYYERLLALAEGPRSLASSKGRAQSRLAALKALEGLDLAKLPDGTRSGAAPGYKGDVGVEVVIKGGKIESVKVASSSEDRPLEAPAEVTDQLVAKQGVKGVEAVSGATLTSEAIIYATARALGQAKQAAPPNAGGYKDGVFTGKARGYRSDIVVAVTIKGGRIELINITSQNETPAYWTRAAAPVANAIIAKQDVASVDTVSGATLSSRAIKNAVQQALDESKRQAGQ